MDWNGIPPGQRNPSQSLQNAWQHPCENRQRQQSAPSIACTASDSPWHFQPLRRHMTNNRHQRNRQGYSIRWSPGQTERSHRHPGQDRTSHSSPSAHSPSDHLHQPYHQQGYYSTPPHRPVAGLTDGWWCDQCPPTRTTGRSDHPFQNLNESLRQSHQPV